MVKNPAIQALDAVRNLLGDVPSVEVESVEYERKIGRTYGVDGLGFVEIHRVLMTVAHA